MYPFVSPCSAVVVGGSQSGKTYFIYRLLKELDTIFTGDTPKRVFFCYASEQALYDKIRSVVPNITFHEGLPSDDILSNLQSRTLLIIDDLGIEAVNNQSISRLITVGVHHKQLTVFILHHSLYSQGKEARLQSQNFNYMVLHRLIRDESSLITLNRQMYPHHPKFLLSVFNDLKSTHYSYLVLDLTARGHEEHRARTHIFNKETTIVYNPKK